MIDDITAVFVLPGFRVLDTQLVSGELTLLVETPRDLVGCPACGAVVNVNDRRTVTARDLRTGGCQMAQEDPRVPTCVVREQGLDRATRRDRVSGGLTERARNWGFEQVGFHDRTVSSVADQLGVAWHTIMTQVSDRGKPLVADPQRLAGCARSGSTRPRSYGH